MRRAWLVALLACRGTLSDPDAFAREFAARWCERQEECEPLDFERAWDSRADCRDEKADDAGPPGTDDPCVLVRDGARSCLAYLRTVECRAWDDDDIASACEGVYDCVSHTSSIAPS